MGRYCTIVKNLKKARATLEEGWCKNALYEDGSHCLVGAIHRAAYGHPGAYGNYMASEYREVFFSSGAIPSHFVEPYHYNDLPSVTKEDILAALDTATEYACQFAIEEEKQGVMPFENTLP